MAKSWPICKKSDIFEILIQWTTRSLYWKLNLVKVEGSYEGFYESPELFQPGLYDDMIYDIIIFYYNDSNCGDVVVLILTIKEEDALL